MRDGVFRIERGHPVEEADCLVVFPELVQRLAFFDQRTDMAAVQPDRMVQGSNCVFVFFQGKECTPFLVPDPCRLFSLGNALVEDPDGVFIFLQPGKGKARLFERLGVFRGEFYGLCKCGKGFFVFCELNVCKAELVEVIRILWICLTGSLVCSRCFLEPFQRGKRPGPLPGAPGYRLAL